MRILLSLLLLAACSDPAPAPQPSVGEATASVAAPSPAQPQATGKPGEPRTFRDWTVACDNGRACHAVALVAEGAEAGELSLAIKREAGPDARAEVILDGQEDADPAIAIDGRPHRGALTPAVLANATGMTATVGGVEERISLAGLAAALRYIDDVQGRAGTVTALVARGPGPASAVPPAPPLPRITQPPRPAAQPRTITVAEATRLIGLDNATCEYPHHPVEPEAHRLDATHSIVLVPHPCGNGAYNTSTSVFVVDEAGRAVPAPIDGNSDMDAGDRHLIVNGDWDPKARRLGSYAKGRGLGDCGVAEESAWDGRRFRLVHQAIMGECRGSLDFMRTWRAEVVGG